MAENDTTMNEQEEYQSPLCGRGPRFVNFPVDEYVPVCIIAYMVAALPPNPKFTKGPAYPVPSVRFLMAGLAEDPEDGQMKVVRKWTGWKSISYNEKSGLSLLFKGVEGLESLLKDDREGGRLWTTPFKCLLEPSGEKYTNITRIKIGEDKGQMDIVYTAEIKETIFKTVRAYAARVPLDVAVIKMEDGVKRYFPDDLFDEPSPEDNDD